MANIKIAYCVTLYNVLNKIIFENAGEEGEPVERKLPFNLKYKLQKNLNMVAKDYAFFESEKQRLIREYGEDIDDGKKVQVKKENFDSYKEEVVKIMNMEVERNFLTLTDKEIDEISDADVECAEMEVFIQYLTE